MSMLSTQSDELRALADKLRGVRFDGEYISNVETLYLSMGAMREAADTIEGFVNALEDVLRNAGDTVWVGKAETLVDRMVRLGIYGHEVYDGARPWEVER